MASKYDVIIHGSADPAKSLVIDVYCVLHAYETKNRAVDHAVKKLLMPGDKGQKDRVQNIKEAIASLRRALEIETKARRSD